MKNAMNARSGYEITCNCNVIMTGAPNIVAHVFSKMTGGCEGSTGDYREYMAMVGTSLKGSELLEGDRFELRVFGTVVGSHVYGQPAGKAATEMDLYEEWLRQVGAQAGTDAFSTSQELLDAFRDGKSPSEGLIADRALMTS